MFTYRNFIYRKEVIKIKEDYNRLMSPRRMAYPMKRNETYSLRFADFRDHIMVGAGWHNSAGVQTTVLQQVDMLPIAQIGFVKVTYRFESEFPGVYKHFWDVVAPDRRVYTLAYGQGCTLKPKLR
jgi:hypothetical protein